jgi:hypothetical protein
MREWFDSIRGNEGFGGNPRVGDEPMSTTIAEWSGTKDGSYLTLEWLNTITRYKVVLRLTNSINKNNSAARPRWRNGSVFVLHTNGGGSIPSRGTKRVSHLYRFNWKV